MIWVKKIGKWLLIALAGILLLFLLLLIAVYFFEDRIKAYAVERINKNLNTEIQVSDIDLTIWSNFPYASLEFRNVLIMDPTTVNKDRDTMLFAKKLSMEFSIWDIVYGDYSVKEVNVDEAQINLFIDENGNENYHFWKDSEEKSEDKFEFDLQMVNITGSEITYINRISGEDYSFYSTHTSLSGNFKEDEFDLTAESDLKVNHFKSGRVALLRNKKTKLELDIHVNHPENRLSFKQGKLRIEDLLLDVNGWIGIGDSTVCDLEIKTNKVELESIYRIFPKNLSEHLQHYDSKGEVKIDATMKGEISKTTSPVVYIDFSVAGGSMMERESGVKLTELNFKGHYTNFNENETDEIILPELSGRFLDGSFNAYMGIKNFADPKVKVDINGDFNLVTLHKFLRPPRIESMSGKMKTSIHLISAINSDSETMELISANGEARVKNGTLVSKSLAMDLKELNGLIEIRNNDASIEGFSGKKGESDFEINGVIKNFMPYALKENQHINIVASLVSENIRLEDFIRPGGETSEAGPADEYHFPETINFNLDASINKLTYGAFTGRKLKGNFKLLDKKFTATGLQVRMAGGECTGKLSVDGTSDKGFVVETHQKLENINIDQLFTIFENFGQKEITAGNLGGKLNAEIDFFGFTDAQLNLHPEKVVSTAKLEVSDGELKDFLLLSDVVDYMREYKLLAKIVKKKNLDRLEKQVKHIRFSTLTNTIEVRNAEILIPEMRLESNVMNLNLAGTHKFNNDIDYDLNFRFKDLKVDKQEAEIPVEDSEKGLRVFLHITGNVSDPKYDFALKEFLSGIALKTDIREKLNKQNTELKSTLKADLGLFKRDSTVKAKETPREEVKFIYEWDEGKTEAEEATTEEKKEQDRRRTKKQKEKNRVTERKEEIQIIFD